MLLMVFVTLRIPNNKTEVPLTKKLNKLQMHYTLDIGLKYIFIESKTH